MGTIWKLGSSYLHCLEGKCTLLLHYNITTEKSINNVSYY